MAKPKTDQNIKIPDHIIKQLLTPSEFRMLRNRFQIMNLLEEGLSIRKISVMLNVGTDTVVRVSRMFSRRPKIKKIETQTPWVFGKSE